MGLYEIASYPSNPIDRASAIATLATGATPFYHGIVAEQWLDRQTLRPVYCVDDEKRQTTANRLLTSTLGDELKISSQGKAVVYGIAATRDAAILSAGHAADNAFWIDERLHKWMSSPFYSNKRPAWLGNSEVVTNNETVVEKALDAFKASAMGADEVTDMLNVTLSAGISNKNVSNQLNGVSKAIDNIAEEIKNIDTQKFQKEIKQIISICKQRLIDVVDVNIKQENTGRYIVNVYLNTCKKDRDIDCPTQKIEEILKQILEEEVVLQEEKCGMKLEQNMCYQTYVSKDKFGMQIGISRTKKEGETVSGDSSIQIKLKDGKYLLALSDGMGNGPEARKASQIAIKMLGRLLSNGFEKETSIELINNTILNNTTHETYATLDTMVLDLYAGNAEYIKNGAAPTYIKNKKSVDIVKSIALPTGILDNVDLVVYDRDLEDDDIIVMCTDGIVDSNKEYQNKELWVKNMLEEIETENVQKIADIILREAIDNNYGKPEDDMSVIVVKIKRK